jgi:methylated-DNA-protein-cysteine methyltransferase-like protein
MHKSLNERIWILVRMIPFGKVSTYGQIAAIDGKITPRQAGYALAAVPHGHDIPWHRVVNSQGRISKRADGKESEEQRLLLESEGIIFSTSGSIDLDKFLWDINLPWGKLI